MLPLVLITTLAACSSDNFTMGGRFLNSDVRTVIIDTCSIKVSTVSIDSVVTSGKGAILIGSHSDNISGRTQCTAYVTFTVPESQNPPEAEVVFDSIDLEMRLNGIWSGDTTLYHSFDVYPLESIIELPDNNDFYTTDTASVGNILLASFTIRPKPHSGDILSVRLPDNLGVDLLARIMSDDEVLGSQDRFMNYLKGIAIVPGPENNSLLGISLSDTSMVIRLHYHYSTLTRTEGVISITPLQSKCFYGVRTDRTGTPFNDLKGSELSSSLTGNMSLVQALTASYMKIEFPYLNNLLELGDYCSVVKASLIVYPVKGTYSSIMPLPEDLSLYISNENDVTVSAITTYSGDALQTGNLVRDELFGIDTYYTYDITSFIEGQAGAFGIYKRNLQLIVPEDDLSVTINTLVAGDSYYPRGRISIKITYLIYDIK
jgi:hypothetical protein